MRIVYTTLALACLLYTAPSFADIPPASTNQVSTLPPLAQVAAAPVAEIYQMLAPLIQQVPQGGTLYLTCPDTVRDERGNVEKVMETALFSPSLFVLHIDIGNRRVTYASDLSGVLQGFGGSDFIVPFARDLRRQAFENYAGALDTNEAGIRADFLKTVRDSVLPCARSHVPKPAAKAQTIAPQ